MAADFQGGDLTSDGGLPLLREVDQRIGLPVSQESSQPANNSRIISSDASPIISRASGASLEPLDVRVS